MNVWMYKWGQIVMTVVDVCLQKWLKKLFFLIFFGRRHFFKMKRLFIEKMLLKWKNAFEMEIGVFQIKKSISIFLAFFLSLFSRYYKLNEWMLNWSSFHNLKTNQTGVWKFENETICCSFKGIVSLQTISIMKLHFQKQKK